MAFILNFMGNFFEFPVGTKRKCYFLLYGKKRFCVSIDLLRKMA